MFRQFGRKIWKTESLNTFSNECLGSHNDEERSEMRYVMRIAWSASHQNFERSLHFLWKYVCWSVCAPPTSVSPYQRCFRKVDQVVPQSGMIEICVYDFSREIVFAVVVNNREGGFTSFFLSCLQFKRKTAVIRLRCINRDLISVSVGYFGCW